MAHLTIYFGQIFIEDANPGQRELVPDYSPGKPIRDCLERTESVERYGHQWVIGNLEFDASQPLATGRLGYPDREERRQEEFVPDRQEFVETEIEFPHAISAAFVLDYETGAMAFEEHDRIGPTGFVNHFTALLTDAGGSRFTFHGELIRLADNYRDFLRRVDRVTQVSFDVFPTNPRDSPIFRLLDIGMKAMHAKRQRSIAENTEEGLKLSPPASQEETTDNPAIMGIEMTEAGYGTGYRIDAEIEGRPVRYDSKVGGGLAREVFELVDDPEKRLELLRECLTEREKYFPAVDGTPVDPNQSEESSGDGDKPT